MLHLAKTLLVPMLLLSIAASARAAGPTAPTAADVRQAFEASNYHDVIREATRIMNTKGWQANKEDALLVVSLKAEAHLRLKEGPPAITSFEMVARMTPDPNAASVARSTAFLIKHSLGFHYQPQTAPAPTAPGEKAHGGIDIVDPEQRKDAFAALYADQKAAITPTIAPAIAEGAPLGAIMNVAPGIGRLHDFEVAATGADTETAASATALAEHGRDQLNALIKPLADKADPICELAMTLESYYVESPSAGRSERWHYHGFEGQGVADLKQILGKLSQVNKVLVALMDDMPAQKETLDPVATEVQRIANRSEKALTTDFTRSFASRDMAK